MQKRHGAVAGRCAGAVAFGVALTRGSLSLLGLLTQNTALLGMLAAVSFLRLLVASPGAAAAQVCQRAAALWRTCAVHVLGAADQPVGGRFIMADRIGADGKPRQDRAAVLVRAFLAAALVVPFFAATGGVDLWRQPASVWRHPAWRWRWCCCARRSGHRAQQRQPAADFIGYPMQASALKVPAVLAVLVGPGTGWCRMGGVALAGHQPGRARGGVRRGAGAAGRAAAAMRCWWAMCATACRVMSGELALFLSAAVFASGLR